MKRTSVGTAAALVGLVAVMVLPAQGATPKTKLVSVRSNGTQGDGGSFDSSISANGRFVTFESDATNLVGGDDNGKRDIFVHDKKTKKTRRVSVRSNGAEAEDSSHDPAISANGRFVVFYSNATNLVGNDDNGNDDVFVHDRRTKKTKRVSVRSNGAEADGHSIGLSISAEGRFVAFGSGATNLVRGDDNDRYDIFVHDRRTGKTKRVSVRSNGAEADSDNYNPSISGDGRLVAFFSEATNLVGSDDNADPDIFVHDRRTGKTKRVSVRSNGTEGDGTSSKPSISASGRFVAFESGATNLVGGDTNTVGDVFVHDRRTGKTKRVSVRSNGDEGDEYSEAPSLSANGRFVAFKSEASNFVAGDISDGDIFVHDRKTKKTKRVSLRSNGTEGGPGDSFSPSISADARFVAFHSNVENFVPGDNGFNDVFVRGPLR